CAVTAALATLRWPRAYLANLAAAAVVPGTLWALWGFYPDELHRWGFVLGCEALALQLAGLWLTRKGGIELGTASERWALLAGALAATLPICGRTYPPPLLDAGTFLVLAVALLARTLDRRSGAWLVGVQLALGTAVVYAVTTLAEPRGWFADFRCLQA